MTEESGYVTISLHKTKECAQKAIEFHKQEKRNEYDKLWKNEEPPCEFGAFEDWHIGEKTAGLQSF